VCSPRSVVPSCASSFAPVARIRRPARFRWDPVLGRPTVFGTGFLERCVSPVETARLEIVCALAVPGVRIPPSPSIIHTKLDDRRRTRPGPRAWSRSGAPGEVTEWLKVHAWNACVGFTPYRGFESLPLRWASAGSVRAPGNDREARQAAGRWWLGPAQDGVANPVRSGRKQRYRMSLCAAGNPSHHRRATRRRVSRRA
jgi:hypothetical protein